MYLLVHSYMSTFKTQLDLAQQARIDLGATALFNGSINLGQNIAVAQQVTLQGVQLVLSGATGGQILAYDAISNQFQPSSTITGSIAGSQIVVGMQVSNDLACSLNFDISAGIYQITTSSGLTGTSITYYNFTATTATTLSGSSQYSRYDILYVTGGTGYNNVYVQQGTPAPIPTIPVQPQGSVLLAIVNVPSGTTCSSPAPQIITVASINAKFVSYQAGQFTNVSDFLDSNYVRPQITQFVNNVSPLILGQSAGTVTFNWASNKTGLSYTLSPSGGTFNRNTFATTLSGLVLTGSSTNTAITYTLSFYDGVNTVTSNSVIDFYDYVYYGTYSSTTLTSAVIQQTFSAITSYNTARLEYYASGNGNYFFFCYPAVFGGVHVYVNGILNNDYQLSTQAVTNIYGYTEMYNVLQFNQVSYGSSIKFSVFPA